MDREVGHVSGSRRRRRKALGKGSRSMSPPISTTALSRTTATQRSAASSSPTRRRRASTVLQSKGKKVKSVGNEVARIQIEGVRCHVCCTAAQKSSVMAELEKLKSLPTKGGRAKRVQVLQAANFNPTTRARAGGKVTGSRLCPNDMQILSRRRFCCLSSDIPLITKKMYDAMGESERGEIVPRKNALLGSLLESAYPILIRHVPDMFLSCGSFLGLWREKGIIPWDDDIDFTVACEKGRLDEFVGKAFSIARRELMAKGLQFNRMGKHWFKVAVKNDATDAASQVQSEMWQRRSAQWLDGHQGSKTRFGVKLGSGDPRRQFSPCSIDLNVAEKTHERATGALIFREQITADFKAKYVFSAVYPLQKSSFLGVEVNVHRDGPGYLVTTYGDWQAPR